MSNPSMTSMTQSSAATEFPTTATNDACGRSRWKHLWNAASRAAVRFGDTAGLSFVAPLVHLINGDDRRQQLRVLLRVVVMPVAAFSVFLLMWTVVAPHHRTKSGVVPQPSEVWAAAKSIWTFHERESQKESAYKLASPERELRLAKIEARLQELEPYEAAATSAVATLEQQQTELNDQIKKMAIDRRSAREQAIGAQQTARLAELSATSSTFVSGSLQAKEAYLQQLRSHLAACERERAELQTMDGDRTPKASMSAKLARVRQTQAALAEERQYLTALADQLSTANGQVKLEREIDRLRESQRRFLSAQGPDVLPAAEQVLQAEQRIRAVETSVYAKPWTLPMQIVRSVACVFVGFALGSAIAVPVGVLCGLSPTFMSAMTPFIALFKPVSPIVWLPLALIVVGGFIPDPDHNVFLNLLSHAPLIGWLKINPAFIASAVTVALCSLWATLVNTALGVACVDADHLNVARVLQLDARTRLFKIIVPAALPLIFTGLRISLGVGWMVLIAGELLSSSEGIGKFVWDQFNNGASDSFAKMIVVVFLVGAIGLLLDRLMVILQRSVSFDKHALAM